MFFKKRFIKKYRSKLAKIKNRNNQKILDKKMEFSKILNHDIKTAILAQNNCLELLLNGSFGALSSFQKEIISQILFSNKFLAEITNNAIFLAEFEEKTSILNFEEINIVNQTEFCLDSIKKLADNKHQNIIFDNKNEKINLSADKAMVQKIIFNLLTSSVSYGHEKSDIVVSIEENNNEILFKAKNKSLYMTKEKLNSIFENTKNNCDFNQLGMKLNLNIAKKLVNALKWEFVATSDEEEKTSTFGFVVKK